MVGQEQSPAQIILQLATGNYAPRALYVVAKLGIADLLADGDRAAEELAMATKTNPDALYRVLRCLSGFGIFREQADRRFSLTPVGETLRSDAPNSTRAYTLMIQEENYHCWGDLLEAVRTGEPSFAKLFGVSRFEFLQTNPEAAAIFQRAMADLARAEIPAIVDVIDFAGVQKVVDVGGGNGALLSAILGRHDHLSGVLLDLAPGIEAARTDAGGPLPRCELVVGDFFEDVPAGGDVYVLKQILHNWPDDECVAILSQCCSALSAVARVLVIERVIGMPNEPSPVTLQDLNMLVTHGGRERTEKEFSQLFVRAGLRLTGVSPTPTIYRILEAVADPSH
jgi:hypothetical protein